MGLPTGIYWLLTAFAAAVSLLIGWSAWRAFTTTEPEIVTVEGPLRAATTDKFGIRMWVSDNPIDFLLSPESLERKALIETRIRIGATMQLEVDAADLHEATEAEGGNRTVQVHGLLFGGERYASPDDMRRAADAERSATAWGSIIGVVVTFFLAFCAVRRGALQEPVAEASSAPPEVEAGDLLALRAPFVLHPRFGERERKNARLVLLVTSALGAVPLVGGAREVARAAEIAAIWERGGSSVEAVVAQALISTGAIKTYRLQLEYELDGRRHTAEDEWTLWFEEWPVPATVSLRFDARPPRFVSELQYRARAHTARTGWSLVAGGAFLLGVGLIGAGIIRRKLQHVRELARMGSLARADVVELREVVGDVPERRLRYNLPWGQSVTESMQLSTPPPLLRDGQVIVLASRDHRTSCALRSDGYPLDIPQLASR